MSQYQYELGLSSVNISPHHIITLSTDLYILNSLFILEKKYLQKERTHLGNSCK